VMLRGSSGTCQEVLMLKSLGAYTNGVPLGMLAITDGVQPVCGGVKGKNRVSRPTASVVFFHNKPSFPSLLALLLAALFAAPPGARARGPCLARLARELCQHFPRRGQPFFRLRGPRHAPRVFRY